MEGVRLNRNSEASKVCERAPAWRVGKGSLHRDYRPAEGSARDSHRENDWGAAAGALLLGGAPNTVLLDPTLGGGKVASVCVKHWPLDG